MPCAIINFDSVTFSVRLFYTVRILILIVTQPPSLPPSVLLKSPVRLFMVVPNNKQLLFTDLFQKDGFNLQNKYSNPGY